ncbi:hypothetical protein Acr_15g0007920 [Actinidia rufa]|uniref:Uncharacterized protein n=1 Tax=Actinidia rufa TaxID=165716 RepID=A0A7J0FU14_9ERIC|nr:hypothetical protein Acr_15g0007920 [Actinidia rufa]
MPSRAGRSFDSDTGSSGKERLKWNNELHDLFEKAVNQLGGPDRVTPKGILKAMGIPDSPFTMSKVTCSPERLESPNPHSLHLTVRPSYRSTTVRESLQQIQSPNPATFRERRRPVKKRQTESESEKN